MFKISRLRQVLLVRKASTTFAYARFTPLLSVFDCEIRETAIRLDNTEFLANRSDQLKMSVKQECRIGGSRKAADLPISKD